MIRRLTWWLRWHLWLKYRGRYVQNISPFAKTLYVSPSLPRLLDDLAAKYRR